MLEIKFRVSSRRTRKIAENFIAFAEHVGVLCGGGWDTGKGEGEFYLEAHHAHGACDCDALPPIKRISPKLRQNLLDWLTSHKGVSVEWKQ